MQWSEITAPPTRRTLRQFAGLWTLFFGGLALWQGFGRDRPELAIGLGILAVAGGALGLARPQALRWIYTGWMIAVFPIGWVVSHVVLAVMFFGVITPIALLFRLRGRDALRRKRDLQAASYWQPKPAASDVRSYFKQY
jgi:hypothetical protein